ncbi:AraC family transcriptional regulator [Niabella sp. CC-SYL272]|uniref:AraC family transcriptional regulator n=1 Tax=Niabella agricola TaxID=2891571 RepID=UPI001F345D4D|nr:AraC family transcriptional regulator [Niabella agricola]MCF3109641.1 AraC family transcriptional regulator [Niabella agricola]
MISEVLVYINNHLGDKITLEQLAAVTGYSPSHLHKKLSAELGISLGKYIQNQRMHTAAYFLAMTRLPLNEIRYLVGFEDDSAFGRAFRKLYLVSPLQYRKSQRHQQASPLQAFRYISTSGTVSRVQPQTARVFASRGNYFDDSIYNIWRDVRTYIRSVNRVPEDFEHYAVLHECPHVTGNRACRYDAAIVPKGFNLPVDPYLQTTVLSGTYIQFNFCSRVQDYKAVTAEVNTTLARQTKLRHRPGVSYFKFDSMPDPDKPDHLLIRWYLPVM